jgi:hypothetical protein
MDSFGVGAFIGIFLYVLTEFIMASTPHECMVTYTTMQGSQHVYIGVTK